MDPNLVSAIGTTLSAVAAFVAVIVSVIVYRGQAKLTAQMARDQAAISVEDPRRSNSVEPAAVTVASMVVHHQSQRY